jgi:hypothetical protein
VGADNLNKAATALGPNFNIFANSQGTIVPVAPAFVEFEPSPYLRPFDAADGECDFAFFCRDPFSPLQHR